MVAILGYSREQIVSAVQDMYTAVADAPASPFHFPVGGAACRVLGYPREQLEALPHRTLESFAGVGYPFRAGAVRRGDTALDIGAGAGNDSLIAARLVGRDGHVIAVDLTLAMTRKLRYCVAELGARNVDVLQGSAEALPLADESIDSITSNGALNLVPDKRRAIGEMFRVLRPGGRLQIADVVIRRPVTVDCRQDPRLWVECIVGATVEENLLAMFRDAGFESIEVVGRHDYFSYSPSAQTRDVAAGFGASSIEVSMHRGPRAPGRLRQWLRRCDPRRLLAATRQQGLAGVAGMVLALLACYGTLGALALLGVLGVSIALDESAWAGAIATCSLLTAAAVAAGYRRHQATGPGLLAVTGTVLVLYALFVDYRLAMELLGFTLLAAGVAWDLRQRRLEESRALGLQKESRS